MQAVVVAFDHLALAFLGCYGNTWIRTPRFNQLAAGSVVFDQCYCAAPSKDSFQGLLPLAERLRTSGGFAVVQNCGNDGKADVELQRAIADWQGALVGGSPALLWLKSPGIESPWSAQIDRIVACWEELFPLHPLPEALAACGIGPADPSASAEESLAAAWPQLLSDGLLSRDCLASTPLFGRLRRTIYAAAVSVLDAWLGDVLDLLNDSGRPDTLLIVAAGAGDLAGPHAELSAGCPPLIDPLLHVPLLIRTGMQADGTRRGGLVSTADLAPTLAAWFHMEHSGIDSVVSHADENITGNEYPLSFAPHPGPPPEKRGEGETPAIERRHNSGTAYSVWPMLKDETHAIREDLLIGSEATGWSLRTLRFACLCDPAVADAAGTESSDRSVDRTRLFVKPDDAWDMLNVAGQFSEITTEYSRRIRKSLQAGVERVDDR